jgi:hypothetical protein
MAKPVLVASAVVLLNMPFGYWRAGVRKLSLPWFVAVHAPVPLVIALRLVSGMGFKLWTYPLMVGAYFTGQFLGGRLRTSRGGNDRHAPGS